MMLEQEVTKINDIKFSHLEQFKCGEALIVSLQGNRNISIGRAIKNFIGIFLKTQYLVDEFNTNGPMFFFMSAYCGRSDYQRDFEKITNFINNTTTFCANSIIKFDLKKIPALLYWIKWNYQMKNIKFSHAFRMSCCNQLLRGYYALQAIKQIHRKRQYPRAAITFCDFFPEDYFVTEYFNQVGVPTATLQHAVYYHKSNGFGYKYSNSRYFLGVSEYAKTEALKSGYDNIQNFYICGPMKFINQELVKKPYKAKMICKLGVALSGGQYEYENRKLIECALDFSTRIGCDLVIRPHPTINMLQYNHIIGEKEVEISIGPMDEFVSKSDMFIVGNSNVFADLISMECLVCRMIINEDNDAFEDVSDFKFKNSKELYELYCCIERNSEETKSKIMSYKHWFVPEGNIGERYAEAINQIIKKNEIKLKE